MIEDSMIEFDKIPSHLAIIMDGNGRWATKRGYPRSYGHNKGVDRVIDVVELAKKYKIKYLSLYAFSTENWKRPEKEVSFLFRLLVKYIDSELDKLINNDVKLIVLGDINPLPDIVKEKIKYAIEKTKNNGSLILNIAINYGAKQEILRAVNNIIDDKLESVDEKTFRKYLYTKDQPDVDLLIRPGGEMRLSNFLLYQMSYAEIYFCETFWPDFSEEDFVRALDWFSNKDRRFGGIK